MRDLWETIKYMIRKECERNSLADLCEHWDVSIDDFYTFLNAADRAEAEVERYKLMVKSITGGLDEAIETVHYLEAENALLRKVADAANDGNTFALVQALAELDEGER